jgi:hypothetical protein
LFTKQALRHIVGVAPAGGFMSQNEISAGVFTVIREKSCRAIAHRDERVQNSCDRAFRSMSFQRNLLREARAVARKSVARGRFRAERSTPWARFMKSETVP